MVGELAPPGHDERGAPGGPPVTSEELRRRVPRAAARELDQLGIAAHAHDHIVLRSDPMFASPSELGLKACHRKTCTAAISPHPREGFQPASLVGDASARSDTEVW